MTRTGAGTIDREYLHRFCRSHAIDEFVVVPVSGIHAPPGRRPIDLLPSCVPLLARLLRAKTLEPLSTVTANRIAARSTPWCSAGLIACPHFHKPGR